MSAERVDVLNLSQVNLHESPSSHSLLFRLKQTLNSCSKSIEAEEFRQSEESISKITELLNSVSDAVVSEPENEAVQNEALAVLTEIHQYITEPSLDQAVIDALSFELPKAVARFASASHGCVEIAKSVIDHFIGTCSPRDMIAVLCEALGSPSKMFKTHGYFDPLLSGLPKVFVAIQRRHFEQIKAAVPVVLNVLTAVSLDSNDRDENSKDLFDRSIGIANSIQAVCVKLDDKVNEKLRALLGLFVMQIMALVSISLRDKISSCLDLVKQLSHILRSCNISYLGLITGYDIDTLTSIVLGDDEDDYMSCFSHVKHGASLAVIWGHMSNEVAQAADDDLASVKDELCRDQTKRWQAIKMLKHILSWVELRWDLKSHAIIFLLYILNGNVPHKYNSAHVDDSVHMLGLFASLQAIEMVIIYAPDAALRKNAFDALKRVLVDIPSSHRFDILLALIKNSDSSSMIAILIGRLKEEMHIANCQKISVGNDEVLQAKDEASQFALFWSAGVLELVDSVLRPPQGGPPSLPEYSDAVLSALNLYRFVLITESKGKTNYTGVLSRNNLEKAYNEWFLPLRTLVSGIVAETRKDCDELAYDTVCAINPIELVLYRCIELVEEKLKHST
ncbi:aberrant root formation protein 4 isoform X2 [Cornus florida]|uniref:aberrant root formation protein 4 isoform X2 n=1 Tax=Cornus florida TaxID=4283 RepID=UPI0028982965|nr:aberrant root formation protein 4 isoform X2 [Cornus florida]